MTKQHDINQAMKVLSALLENTPNIVAVGRSVSPQGTPEIEVVFLDGTQLAPGRVPDKIMHIPVTVRYISRNSHYPISSQDESDLPPQ